MTSAGASGSTEHWRRIKAIAADGFAQPIETRAAFVRAAAAGDTVLEAEAMSLLEAMTLVGERFDIPALAMHDARAAAAELIDARRPALVGDLIGPWQLVRELGRGGMAVVYLGERTGADFTQRVAIKLVRAAVDDELLLARFREERRILAALEHPLIARFIDGGTTASGLPYVVMEYVEGMPIDAYCDQRNLSQRERVDLFRRVCTAVHYAHQHLVVHRDIKASNILVDAAGNPKLLDFGIAKILDPALSTNPTQTLVRMVTPESASPEQIRGEPVTTASDVYALGVLLYRLVTGRSPYGVPIKSDADMVRAICDHQPAAPDSGTRDLDLIVLMALRKEAERRYRTADQFADDLQRLLDGHPVLAADDSLSYRSRKFIGRHRLGVAAAAAFAVAIAAGTAATAWQARVAARERNRAQRQFNAVRSLANALLGELHDAVAKLPNSLPASELLMRRATDYLDSLSNEAADDAALRRELAFGYARLGQIQGADGRPNLGDRAASRRTLEKAAALFQSLDPRQLDVPTRLAFADVYVRLAGFGAGFNDQERADFRSRAQAIVDPLLAALPADPQVLSEATALWWTLGVSREFAKDYEGARALFLKAASASEAHRRLKPDDDRASRNLSVVYRKVGTEEELLRRPDQAISWYRKALNLDADRLARNPGSALNMLDASFSHGAIGAALSIKGDVAGSLSEYREAVDLRRAAAAVDPNDDFAQSALVWGYDRVAGLLQRAGEIRAMIETQRLRLAISRQRLAAHPDRQELASDHGSALVDAIGRTAPIADANRSARRLDSATTAHLNELLKELMDAQLRGQRHQPPLQPVSDDEFQKAVTTARAALGR